MDMKYCLLIAVAFWNLVVFLLYAVDKRRAKSGSWRISERTLIFGAICLGGLGAIMGVYLLRHKTRHMKFRILIPLSLLITIAGAMTICIHV